MIKVLNYALGIVSFIYHYVSSQGDVNKLVFSIKFNGIFYSSYSVKRKMNVEILFKMGKLMRLCENEMIC